MDVIQGVLAHYFINQAVIEVQPLTSGLINETYRVTVNDKQYILQSINTQVFKTPEILISNILEISEYLQAVNYTKPIIHLIPNIKQEYLTIIGAKAWRLSEYIPNTICFEKVQSSQQAFEAAKALSDFHAHLFNFPIEKIKPSIPGFLDYSKRVDSFKQTLQYGNKDRIKYAQPQIKQVLGLLYLVDDYLVLNFPVRLVHADAKISNFLFDATNSNHVKAVIDWDTMMPGNILCDFGDMVRTYANLKPEDDPSSENNFSEKNYEAVKQGFLTFLKDKLLPIELKAIDLTAQVVILIQAIRFLTDYLNNDIYYYTTRENQNLDRTINQLQLLNSILKKM